MFCKNSHITAACRASAGQTLSCFRASSGSIVSVLNKQVHHSSMQGFSRADLELLQGVLRINRQCLE